MVMATVMDVFNVLFTKVYTAATKARGAAASADAAGGAGGNAIVSEPVGQVPARTKDFTREPQ